MILLDCNERQERLVLIIKIDQSLYQKEIERKEKEEEKKRQICSFLSRLTIKDARIRRVALLRCD